MTRPSRKRIPQQRVVGREPTDLSSEALSQWRTVEVNQTSLRRIIGAKVGPVHEDDVWSKARISLHKHLKTHGAVEKVLPYFSRILFNEVARHFTTLAERAELYIGDDTYLLEDPDQLVHVVPTMQVELGEAMAVLKSVLSERQLKVFVVTEAYGLSSRQVAKALGDEVKPATVRSDLMKARLELRTPNTRARLGLGPIPE